MNLTRRRIRGCELDFVEHENIPSGSTQTCLAATSFSLSILFHGISLLGPELQTSTGTRPSKILSHTYANLKHTVLCNVFAWVLTQSFSSRLTPVYLFVLGLVEVTMRALHNNSVFEPKVMDHLNCENYWWRNALYINSLYPRREMVSQLSPIHIILCTL
jgi:hypothetical protein